MARIGTPHPSQLNTTQTAIDGLDLLAMADYACAETLGRVGRSELSRAAQHEQGAPTSEQRTSREPEME